MKVFNRDVVVNGTIRQNVGAAVAASGAATLNRAAGKVTSESLTTAQNLFYTLTITNDKVKADSVVFASVANGTNTQGTPMVVRVTPANGSLVVVVQNKHASSEALNGTLVVSFLAVGAPESV